MRFLKTLLKLLLWITIWILVIVGIAAIIGIILQLLWNMVLPQIFNVPTINYLQAVIIVIISKLLFGFNLGELVNSIFKRKQSTT